MGAPIRNATQGIPTVRVSTLEAFRRWRASEDGDTERLIADIRGTREPSLAMRRGTAFHALLELAGDGELPVELVSQGFLFLLGGLDADVRLSPIRELRATKLFSFDDRLLQVTGKTDDLYGMTITDHKLTGRFDHENYADSAQWRLYLELFEADEFCFNVFEGREDPRDEMCFHVKDLHGLRFYRYPDMQQENQRLVADFLDFCDGQQIDLMVCDTLKEESED